MDKELYEKGEVEVAIINGDVVVKYEGKGASNVLTLKADYFLDKLMEAIPGEIDDAVLGIVKGALKG